MRNEDWTGGRMPQVANTPRAAAPQAEGSNASGAVVGGQARRMDVERLSAWYSQLLAIRNLSLSFEPGHVTAIIGPSGCGKSTLVRCLDRMHAPVPHARARGRVLLDGLDIY